MFTPVALETAAVAAESELGSTAGRVNHDHLASATCSVSCVRQQFASMRAHAGVCVSHASQQRALYNLVVYFLWHVTAQCLVWYLQSLLSASALPFPQRIFADRRNVCLAVWITSSQFRVLFARCVLFISVLCQFLISKSVVFDGY